MVEIFFSTTSETPQAQIFFLLSPLSKKEGNELLKADLINVLGQVIETYDLLDNNTQISNHFDDEIDLRELFALLWAGRVKIIAITAVFAVASVIYALSVPNQYKATILLSPSQSTNSGISGALGQLGGLASLAGVSIGGGESNESQLAQEIMK